MMADNNDKDEYKKLIRTLVQVHRMCIRWKHWPMPI